jgi:hypothetical protein
VSDIKSRAATGQAALEAPADMEPQEYKLLGWAATLLACSKPADEIKPADWRAGTENWREAYHDLVITPAAQEPHAADGKTAGEAPVEPWRAAWLAFREAAGFDYADDRAPDDELDAQWIAAWQAAAAALETQQLRLAREGRDSLKRRVLALAAEYGDACGNDKIDGYTPGSLYTALRAEVLNAAGGRLRKLLEDE